MNAYARDRFLALFRAAVERGELVKLTLGKPAGPDPTLRNLLVRPVQLNAGPRLACVWRYDTRDVTKNYGAAEALALLAPLIGTEFLDAHLFTAAQTAQLECGRGAGRLRVIAQPPGDTAAGSLPATPPHPSAGPARSPGPGATRANDHDRSKARAIPADAPWLRALGVTEERGRPRPGMADKFRQIERFAELLAHLVAEAPWDASRELTVFDMGCGKGYLTFAVSALLGRRAQVFGVEARPELVDFCARTAAAEGFGARLAFRAGTIADTPIDSADLLIALHACDTATDDALARGIAAGAGLLVVAPCCQKELRPALAAPPVLADALRHGIFRERQAEFVTDALRAQLLEWAGYRTKVFEFISTEHTAKNTMIAGVRIREDRPSEGGRHRGSGEAPAAGSPRVAGDPALAQRIREFAAFYGIRRQRLADHLNFPLA
jgi:SAM-dependent methyltransferase